MANGSYFRFDDDYQVNYHHNRDHFVHAPSQWETTLQCNVVSHWLGACAKWSRHNTLHRGHLFLPCPVCSRPDLLQTLPWSMGWRRPGRSCGRRTPRHLHTESHHRRHGPGAGCSNHWAPENSNILIETIGNGICIIVAFSMIWGTTFSNAFSSMKMFEFQ